MAAILNCPLCQRIMTGKRHAEWTAADLGKHERLKEITYRYTCPYCKFVYDYPDKVTR